MADDGAIDARQSFIPQLSALHLALQRTLPCDVLAGTHEARSLAFFRRTLGHKGLLKLASNGTQFDGRHGSPGIVR